MIFRSREIVAGRDYPGFPSFYVTFRATELQRWFDHSAALVAATHSLCCLRPNANKGRHKHIPRPHPNLPLLPDTKTPNLRPYERHEAEDKGHCPTVTLQLMDHVMKTINRAPINNSISDQGLDQSCHLAAIRIFSQDERHAETLSLILL